MIKTFLIFACFTYLLVLVVMYVYQRKLMYYPEKLIYDAAHYGVPAAIITPIKAEDGTSLEIWHLLPPKTGGQYLLYFHGNAGHIGDRMEKLRIYNEAGFGVIGVSYRGFGRSEGSPSEMGLYMDAKAAFRYAQSLGLEAKDLILYGESLGSGIATETAKWLADNGTPAKGLVLEAPYTSVAGRAQEKYPFIPARYLVHDKFESIAKIKGIHCPLLIFHGARDAVIPIHHGRTLLATALDPKEGIFFDEVDHTQFPFTTLAGHLKRFAGIAEDAQEEAQ